MLDLIPTGQYKKDCRRMEKRGSDMTRLDAVVEMLRRGEKLPDKYDDHKLHGKDNNCRECHIEPSCYKCKFKSMNRPSDITLGDCWGIENIIPEMYDKYGVSAVVLHSDKGLQIWNRINARVRYKETDIDTIVPISAASRRSAAMHKNRHKFFRTLNCEGGTEDLLRLIEPSTMDRIKNKIMRAIRRRG